MTIKLIILLLIVGCEETTEPDVHPLVGIWEVIEQTGWSEANPVVIEYDLSDITATYIFNDGGDFITNIVINGQTETENGTWSATDNEVTMIYSPNLTTDILDYLINDNILTLTYLLPEAWLEENNPDGDMHWSTTQVKLQKQ